MKKYLLFGMLTAILAGALVLAGCDTGTGGGKEGLNGSSAAIYLAGEQPVEAIQHSIDSGAPKVVLAGVKVADTSSGANAIIVPEGKTLELLGNFELGTGGGGTAGAMLVVVNAASITGEGKIRTVDTITGQLIVADESLKAKTSLNNANHFVPFGTISSEGALPAADSNGNSAIRGNVTIGAYGKVNNLGSDVSTTVFDAANTYYILGDLMLQKALTQEANFFVFDDVTVDTVDQTAAINYAVDGTLNATKAPTAVAGTINARTLVTPAAGVVLSVSGTVRAETLIAGAGAITTGTGGLSVKNTIQNATFANGADISGDATNSGTTKFEVSLGNGSAATTLTFNETTTITGIATLSGGSATPTIAGSGAVTLTAAPVLVGGLNITNSGGVTLAATFSVPVTKSIVVSGNGKFIAAGAASATGTVIFQKATLASGAAGQAVIAAHGSVTFGSSTTFGTLVLAPGGSFETTGTTGKVALYAASVFKGEGTWTNNGTANITLKPDADTGAGASIVGTSASTLTADGGTSAAPLLAIAKTCVASGNKQFVLTNVTVDISAKGTITVDEDSDAGVILLTNATGKIQLGSTVTSIASDDITVGSSVIIAAGLISSSIASNNTLTANTTGSGHSFTLTAAGAAKKVSSD